MNTILFPLLVVWIALALGVLTLFMWRQTLARNEDDSLHVMHGALTQQTSLSQKLDVIDKWGKILTVITRRSRSSARCRLCLWAVRRQVFPGGLGA